MGRTSKKWWLACSIEGWDDGMVERHWVRGNEGRRKLRHTEVVINSTIVGDNLCNDGEGFDEGIRERREVDDEWWPEIRNYGCCLLVEIGRSGGGRLWWSMVRLWRMKKSYRHFSIFATFNNFNSMSSTWFVFLQNWVPSLSFYIYIWDFPFNLWDSTKAFLLIKTFVNFNFQETKKTRIENRQ